ncbi:MAG: tripartite tricarboxylate transporter substrate-binding protein, partial [Burkholderiales bacterium]
MRCPIILKALAVMTRACPLLLCSLMTFTAASAAAQGNSADRYPSKPIRMIVPFVEVDASGLVSRRPARGMDAQAAGFYTVAMATTQSYPTKPIRLIVPFAPGGGTDMIARVLGQETSGGLSVAIVVDNRGGAGGVVGTELGVRAPADGYTLTLG